MRDSCPEWIFITKERCILKRVPSRTRSNPYRLFVVFSSSDMSHFSKKRLPHPRFSIRICHLEVVELVFKKAHEDLKKRPSPTTARCRCAFVVTYIQLFLTTLSTYWTDSVAACMWILVKFTICLFSVSRQQLHWISPATSHDNGRNSRKSISVFIRGVYCLFRR